MTVAHTIASSLVAFACSSLLSAAPIETSRWTNPCGGGSPPSSPNLSTDSPYEVNLIISDIIAMCEIARQHAANLKMKIHQLTDRLSMTEEDAETDWKDKHLEGFPVIGGSEQETVGEHFLRAYERLSRVAVFLKQLTRDEKAEDYLQYKQDISRVEEAVYSTLCYLEGGIYGQGLDIKSYVTRDIMLDGDRNITQTPTRFTLDYVISRDIETLMGSMKTEYENLKSL